MSHNAIFFHKQEMEVVASNTFAYITKKPAS